MTYFAYPSMWLWLAVPVLLVGLGIWNRLRKKNQWSQLGEPSVLNRMLPIDFLYRRRWAGVLQLVALALWTAALSGPLLGSKLVEFKQSGIDVFIAVDCSASMLAEDLKPNRMAHAKLTLGQLIDRLAGDRIGIIAFAGQAIMQCPLTIDTSAARQILDTIDVGVVPTPGTAIGDAIRLATAGLRAGESSSRVLILLTDGEDHRSDPGEAARDAAQKGLIIFTVGMGTTQGEPIPDLNEQGQRTGYKRNAKGDVVLSKLDEAGLEKIARSANGRYVRATLGGGELDELVRSIDALKQGDARSKSFNRFENRYQWPLGVGLLLFFVSLLLTESRARRLVSLLILMGLGATFSGTASAASAELKEGNRDFKRGRYEAALKKYEQGLIDQPRSLALRFNVGNAAYMNQDFARADQAYAEVAAQAADPLFRSAAHYNRGNALFRQQKLSEAIESYKESLRLNPTDADAKYNLSAALRAKNDPQKQKQDQQKNSADQKKKEDPQKGSGKDDTQPEGDSKQNQPQAGQMSKDDAERLLQAASAGERKRPTPQGKPGKRSGDEDW